MHFLKMNVKRSYIVCLLMLLNVNHMQMSFLKINFFRANDVNFGVNESIHERIFSVNEHQKV